MLRSLIAPSLALLLCTAAEAENTVTTCKAADATTRSATGDSNNCNKKDAVAAAESAARRSFLGQCTLGVGTCARICGTNLSYTGTACIANPQTNTTRCQEGSDKACGVWPARHARWEATVRLEGQCGCNCSTAPQKF